MITTGNDTGNREIVLIKKKQKQSIKTYFYERCLGGPKSSDFWPTIKPFLSNKSNNCKKDIILEEDNNIVEIYSVCRDDNKR
jgi:hypothetical protein